MAEAENKVYRANGIRDVSEYFKILMKFAKLKPDESLELINDEIKILKNEDIKNKVLTSVISVVLSSGTEEKNFEKLPNETKASFINKFYELDFKGKNYTENEKLEIIRNSLAHANFDIVNHNDESFIYINNKKMSGFYRLDEFIGEFSIVYLNVNDMYMKLNYNKDEYSDYFGDFSKLEREIDKLEDLREYLNSVKKLTFKCDKVLPVYKQLYYKQIINSIGGGKLKSFEVKKKVRDDLTEKSRKGFKCSEYFDFDITNLSIQEIDHVLKYIDYIGIEKFNKLNSKEKTIVFSTVLNSFDAKRKEFQSTVMLNNIIAIDKLIGDGKKSISNMDISSVITPLKRHALLGDMLLKEKINGINASQVLKSYLTNEVGIGDINSIIKTDFKGPIDYEMLIRGYSFYMLTYMRELINTNVIDNSILDYDKIDIDSFNPQYRYTKKEITQRRKFLTEKIPNLNKDFDSFDKNIEKLQEKRKKEDNPKNPYRDKKLKELDESIEEIKKRKQERIEEIAKTKKELDYMLTNKKIMPDNNAFFRGLRNSNAHGNITCFYGKFFETQNLDDLEFYFQDIHDGKSSTFNLRTSASNLLKLYDRIVIQVENNLKGKEIGKSKLPDFTTYDSQKSKASLVELDVELENKLNAAKKTEIKKGMFGIIIDKVKQKGITISNIFKERKQKEIVKKADRNKGEDKDGK